MLQKSVFAVLLSFLLFFPLSTRACMDEVALGMHIQVGGHLLTATLVNSSTTEALVRQLSEGSITIDMRDYANMEKVGTLPESLPRNDEPINAEAGDLMLYQANAFVIYYGTNAWPLTRIGKINDITQQDLKDILGGGDVTVTLSLPEAK